VSAIDSTGIRMLRALVRGAHRDGARVILVGAHAQPMIALGRADLLDEIGESDLCGTLDEALDAARTHLGLSPAPRTDPPTATAA
jgi:anti-anti-sigma regulatory factor